jgi:hypothetical protein
MHKSATKCNETIGKWCKNKHGASKIIDTFETYQLPLTKQSLDEAPYKLFKAIAKLAGITFSRISSSYWIDNVGFLLREKLAAIFITPCSWGFQLAGHLLH